MKYSLKIGVLVLLAAPLVGSAIASGSLVGVWHGRIRFDKSSLPLIKDPRGNASRMAALARYEQASLTLTFKGDHSYILRTIGGPRQTPQIEGMWRATGTSVALQQLDHGRELGSAQVYTLDKDGHSFSITKDQAGISTTVSFFK